MKKKILVIMITAILAVGVMTVAYAKGNNINNVGFGRGMMYQNNINNNDVYNKMIDLMKENGFEEGAKAMENRDYKAMSNFMNNITDEQYNKMINIMKSNGYDSMAKMMGSLNRQEMVNIHNSIMVR
ncbi:hypothetical protein [Clostridium omnivorum]|uniref:DUF2680 domain-containing protein n=1 Tax=Clostridium omnivorum TaxID=1604902 RepID=A0ABQ5N1P8_9CLOT|nr:hypothetical protein [Clostridium sp. E14]GLC29129.1 hypothetical protein bsdE14_05390 [Clostridium sp. E14]